MTAKDIMTKNVVTVKKDTPVEEIINVLLTKGISGVPVIDDENNLVGVVSEADLIYKEKSVLPISSYLNNKKKFMKDYRKVFATKADEIMTANVITATEDTTVEELATVMLEKRIKRIPIVQNKKLVGIVSRADIIKTLF